jgi:hypothetical protein
MKTQPAEQQHQITLQIEKKGTALHAPFGDGRLEVCQVTHLLIRRDLALAHMLVELSHQRRIYMFMVPHEV